MEHRDALSQVATLRIDICGLLHMVPIDNLYSINHNVGCLYWLRVGEPFQKADQSARALGFDRISANALAAVGAFLALPVVLLFGFLSDRTNKRGGTVMVAQLCYLITLIVARQAHPNVGKWSRWSVEFIRSVLDKT